MLLKWWRKDCQPFDPIDATLWFQWGYIEDGNPLPGHWYIFIKLPSYRYGPVWYEPTRNARCAWHQRALIFTGPVIGKPAGSHGWRLSECELP